MTEKKKKWDNKFTIEELYQNKNFVPPKEKNLETIFEEPRKAKDGAPILTSVRKYKRYLHFDPTEGKIHKRKLKAKKCIGNLKSGKNSRTRSAAKKPKCNDIFMYIMEGIGESSDSEMETTDDKNTAAAGESTNVNDTCTVANDKCTVANDACTDANKQDNAHPSENVDITSEQEGYVVKEDIEEAKKNLTQDPDTSEKDKPENKERAKSPSRSSCIVT